MTVDVFELAILLILTLLLGALMPVLFEVGRVARMARQRLEDTGPKLDRLVDDAQVSAKELKVVARALSSKESDLVRIRQSVTKAVDAFEKVEKGLRTGSAIGAAIAPAINAFLSSMQDDPSHHHAPELAAEPPAGGSASSMPQNTGAGPAETTDASYAAATRSRHADPTNMGIA